MNNFLKYLGVGVSVFESVMGFIALLKTPGTLTPASAWALVQPPLLTISMVTGAHINMATAQKIVTDAVDTINAVHPPKIGA